MYGSLFFLAGLLTGLSIAFVLIVLARSSALEEADKEFGDW